MTLLSFLSCLFLIFFAREALAHVSTDVTNSAQKICTVIPLGNKQNDVPQILKAFAECDDGGKIIFPADQKFSIAEKLTASARNIEVEWKGIWQMSPDLSYWRQNSYPILFQNHAAGIIFTGSNITINGHGIGGIHGNGDAWYKEEKANTRPGRPMPFVLWNVSDVVVVGFNVWQPPLWAVNVMNGTNMLFKNIYVNATASSAPWGKNWVQNTDGFDTMDGNNITLTGLNYQGGDDCIAIKPRSYNIHVSNVTCRGGNGIAIGSLGQYREDSSVVNVTVTDVRVTRYNEDLHNSAYIKTWIGGEAEQDNYESAGLPRGGGWGIVRNITLSNFHVEGADAGPVITQDNGNNGSFSGTSKMEVSDILFQNFTGFLSERARKRGHIAGVGCSKVKPCHDITFKDINLRIGKNETAGVGLKGKCSHIAKGGVKGLKGSGCEA